VLVSVGLKGVSDGEIVKYSCTKRGCELCLDKCPEVGEEFLDSVDPTRPQRFFCELCALWRQYTHEWPEGRSRKEELRRPRTGESRPVAIPVPIPFSKVTEHVDTRSALLFWMVTDVLNGLNAEFPTLALTEYDLKRANFTEDPRRRVKGSSSSFFEVSFAMADQVRADEAEVRLRQLMSAPFEWTHCNANSEVFMKDFCYDGLTTCPRVMTSWPRDGDADVSCSFPKLAQGWALGVVAGLGLVLGGFGSCLAVGGLRWVLR